MTKAVSESSESSTFPLSIKTYHKTKISNKQKTSSSSFRRRSRAMEEQCTTITATSNGGCTTTATNKNTIETTKADKPVYLLKCPPLVSRALQPRQNPNSNNNVESSLVPPVAKVTVSIDPLNCNEDSSPQFTMELASIEPGTAPRCYSMDMFKDITPMCAFSQTANGKVSVEGKMVYKLEMKPHTGSIEEYGKLCRERTNKYMIKPRQLQVIDDDRTMRIMPGMTAFLPATSKQDKKKTVPVKGTETKRTRRDRGEVESIMFKLLERQPNWTLRQLVQETDQPELFVKDILKDLCVYNNKGANQGTYELKPEYIKR